MKCLQKKYIPEYLNLDLTGRSLDDFESHLVKCSICQKEIEALSSIHQALLSRNRPEPKKLLLKKYRKDSMSLFSKEPIWAFWKNNIFDLLRRTFTVRPVGFRIAQALAFVIFGIFVGRFIYDKQEPTNVLFTDNVQATFSNAIDQEFLQKYFVETEILLLGIENNLANDIELDDVRLNQEIAKSLLIQTLHIQQSISQVTDESVLNYLTSLELLLLEISNADDHEIIQAFTDVRNIVQKTDLLQSSRTIQQKVNFGLLDDI
jgi:hypothetical protein